MSGIVPCARDKQEKKKGKLETCPRGNDSIRKDIRNHYLHFIVEESESYKGSDSPEAS